MKEKQLFVIAGAQRSGSTYLYNLLDSHIHIGMAFPTRPEPKYFINQDQYSKGKGFYLKKYFSDYLKNDSVKCIGEKSTSYIEYGDVPQKIINYFPKAKALIILRNPVDRAISNYFFSYNSKLETRSLNEALFKLEPDPVLENEISVSPFNYIQRGFYSQYLEPWINSFGDNLKIIVFEKLINSNSNKNEVFSFLDIIPPKSYDNSIEKNESQYENYSELEIKLIREKLKGIYEEEIIAIEKLANVNLNLWKKK